MRSVVNADFVALKLDRSDLYMASEPEPVNETAREAEEGQKRFGWVQSKYASVFVVKPDCSASIDRIDALFDPKPYAERLRSSRAKALADHSVETRR